MSASGVGGPSYVIPPELRGGDIPRTVLRGDSRPPEIIFQTGFAARANGTIDRDSLYNYVRNNGASPYVSTTRDMNIAQGFAGRDGWVYTVTTPTDRAIDVNHALGADSPYPGEEEVAVAGGIAGGNIRYAENQATGEVFVNPNYNATPAPPPPANPNAPSPRHDELKRRRLGGEGAEPPPPADQSGAMRQAKGEDAPPPADPSNGNENKKNVSPPSNENDAGTKGSDNPPPVAPPPEAKGNENTKNESSPSDIQSEESQKNDAPPPPPPPPPPPAA